jgi:hypothetical protein
MTSHDNPIFRTLREDLGLQGKPETFNDKVNLLRRATNMPEPEHFMDAFRKDSAETQLRLAQSKEYSAGDLFAKLRKSGLVPNSSKTAFDQLANRGAFFYSDSELLFAPRSGAVVSLPLRARGFGPGTESGVAIGGQYRKAARLAKGLEGPVGSFSTTYVSEYYKRLGATLPDPEMHVSQVFKGVKKGLEGLLDAGIEQRGINISEGAFWTSNRIILDPSSGGFTDLFEAAKGFSHYQTGMNILSKTAGSFVPPQFMELGGTIGEVFARLEEQKTNYFSKLASSMTAHAGESSFVFIKPEYLTGASEETIRGVERTPIKFAGPAMGKIFGTKFEEHTLAKGLFQLANLESQVGPAAVGSPYVVEGMEAISSQMQMGMRIGVVETGTRQQLANLFGEGGALLTKAGADKFARERLVSGSLTLPSVEQGTIGAVERIFGLNLAQGDKLTGLSLQPQLNLGTDFNTLRAAAGRGAGLVDILREGNVQLTQVQRTAAGLRLDFGSTGRQTPATVEMLAAARRFSANMPSSSHPLYKAINASALANVDMLVGVDEFNKMLGPQVYLTNFIDRVSQRAGSAEIFTETFGLQSTGRGVKIRDFDTGFSQAQAMVKKLSGGTDEEKALAREITQGVELQGLTGKAGITSVRTFGVAGGVRLDFMGDINMMNPLRMTASKMETLGTGFSTLGYANAMDDPLVAIMASSGPDWRKGNYSIDPKSGRLVIGKDNIVRNFARTLSGLGALHSGKGVSSLGGSTNVITAKDGLYLQGKKLNLLPDMEQFSFIEGGVPKSVLGGTLLDPDPKMRGQLLYLDLGKEIQLNLGGKTPRGIRYLPISTEIFRSLKGPYDRIPIGRDNPAYQIIETLTELQTSLGERPFSPAEAALTGKPLAQRLSPAQIGALGQGYTKVIQNLQGKEGLAQDLSTIVLHQGTRARLAPRRTDFFFKDMNIERALTVSVTEDDLYDFFKRKGGEAGSAIEKQFNYIKERIKSGKEIFMGVSVDPAQRAEHFQVMRLHVEKGAKSPKIGQLNLNISPFLEKMFERDLDRDVANFLALSGSTYDDLSADQVQVKLAERFKREGKLLKHAFYLHKATMMASPITDGQNILSRLGRTLEGGLEAGAKMIGKLAETLTGYVGPQKSLGYTIVRSADDVMRTLVSKGAKVGSSELGMNTKFFGGDFLDEVVEQYPSKKLGAVQVGMQALYQGAVQKGANKSALEELAKSLAAVSEGMPSSVGSVYDLEDASAMIKGRVSDVLQEQSSKLRAFRDLSYIAESNPSLGKLLDDLERGAMDAVSTAAAEKEVVRQVIDTQSDLISRYLVAGAVIRSKGGTPAVPSSIMSGHTPEAERALGVMLRNLGEVPPEPAGAGAGGIADATGPGGATPSKSMFKQVSDFVSATENRKFVAGAAVGALVGAGIVSMATGPEAPMPRDIDTRQPTDHGPQIHSASPKVYGSGSSMHSPRMSSPYGPERVDGYTMYNRSTPNISISDKRSSYDPRLIESHMRRIANSDYTY